jgi:opacity protein-like surface antigen
MRTVSAHILLTAILMGAAISYSHAATDESGNNATATSPDDALTSEPGTASDAPSSEPGTNTDTTVDTDDEAARKRIEAKLQAKEERAKAMKTEAIEAHHSEFWGRYFGAKFGVNNSSVSGTVNAPNARTFSYGVQGGYIQAGYNWDLSALVVGVGTYADWNNYAIHSNDVAYSSSSYGLDLKLGFPVDYWLPYAKLGYGYNTGNKNDVLRIVSQNSRNIAVGVEYNVAPRWSLIAEYKINNFSNRDKSITIHNKLFTFGFNYYFDKPSEKKKEVVDIINVPIPEPILDPDAAPEAPPPP